MKQLWIFTGVLVLSAWFPCLIAENFVVSKNKRATGQKISEQQVMESCASLIEECNKEIALLNNLECWSIKQIKKYMDQETIVSSSNRISCHQKLKKMHDRLVTMGQELVNEFTELQNQLH